MSRRAFLAAAAALPLAPVAGAGGPDAELIAMCAEHIETARRTAASEWPMKPPQCPLVAAYLASLDRIMDARPQTMAGVVALARVAIEEARNPDGSLDFEGCAGGTIAALLMEDLARIGA
jgi:hypothetical protein